MVSLSPPLWTCMNKLCNVWRVSRRQLSWPRIVKAPFHHHHQHDEIMPYIFHEKNVNLKKKKKIFGKKAGRHFSFKKKAGRHQKGAGRAPCKNDLGRTLMKWHCSSCICRSLEDSGSKGSADKWTLLILTVFGLTPPPPRIFHVV